MAEGINLNPSLEEVAKLVYDLNSEIYDMTGDELPYVELSTNGDIIRVLFLAMVLWDSDNDEREATKDYNDCEPLEPFLRKKINGIAGRIAKINLKGETGL